MITAYTPTFGNSVLHLASIDSLIVTFAWARRIFFGCQSWALSDRIGRRPLLFGCTLLMLITAYPAMLWLIREPSFARLLGVELWLSFIYGSYNGAMVVTLTEIMPVDVRTSDLRLLTAWLRRFLGIHAGTQYVSNPYFRESSIPGCGCLSRRHALGATFFAKPQREPIETQPVLALQS